MQFCFVFRFILLTVILVTMVTKLSFPEGTVSVITGHGGALSEGRETHLGMFPLTAPSSHLRTSKINRDGQIWRVRTRTINLWGCSISHNFPQTGNKQHIFYIFYSKTEQRMAALHKNTTVTRTISAGNCTGTSAERQSESAGHSSAGILALKWATARSSSFGSSLGSENRGSKDSIRGIVVTPDSIPQFTIPKLALEDGSRVNEKERHGEEDQDWGNIDDNISGSYHPRLSLSSSVPSVIIILGIQCISCTWKKSHLGRQMGSNSEQFFSGWKLNIALTLPPERLFLYLTFPKSPPHTAS